MKLRVPISRDTLREDSVAGLVLGVQSVPDGLASGLLAGVNPLAGLYAYMVGTITGAFFTSSAFMAVQATGAMSMVDRSAPAGRATRPEVQGEHRPVRRGRLAAVFEFGALQQLVRRCQVDLHADVASVDGCSGQLTQADRGLGPPSPAARYRPAERG
jgi:hypothetical protein